MLNFQCRMAICGAIVVHGSAISAIAQQDLPAAQAAARADNPLRHGMMTPVQAATNHQSVAQQPQATNDSASAPVASTRRSQTEPPQPKQLSSLQAVIPPNVLTAIYPNRTQGQPKPIESSGAERPTDTTPFEPSNRSVAVQGPVRAASHAEPVRTEMTTDFSRLPRQPELTGSDSFDQTPPPSTGRTLGAFLSEGSGTSEFANSPKQVEPGTIVPQSMGNDSNSNQQLPMLLQKIATSTCIVLVLGVAFMLVAKRFVTTRPGKPAASKTDPTIRIASTLRLTPKSNLHLVEVGPQRVLVACDMTGIKSVVSLSPTFSETLDSFEETGEVKQEKTAGQSDSGNSAAEIEAEMQQKLSQILGGDAFKDVFYRNRAVA